MRNDMSATITLDRRLHRFHQARLLAVGAVLAIAAGGTAIVVAEAGNDGAATKHPAVVVPAGTAGHSDPLVTRYGSQPATNAPIDPLVTRYGKQTIGSYDDLRLYQGRR
jgi:hypothetical protein